MSSGARKVAVVTGASRGLGLEFVSQLRAAGYRVIATCRSPQSADKLAALRAEFGDELEICRMDVSSPASVQEAFAHIKSLVSSVDVVVNNAGIAAPTHPSDPCLSCSAEAMTAVFTTNVVGPLLVVQHAAPLLNPRGSVVLNVSSVMGSIAHSTGGSCSYRASKAALNMLTKNLALEMAPRKCIVIAMHPGWCDTDMGSAGGRTPPVSPAAGVAGMLRMVAAATPEHAGGLFDWERGDRIAW